MTNHNNLRKMVTTIGAFLIAISLYCSFLLYTSFSDNLGDKAAWGGMGLGLDMFKNVALLAALALWALGYFAARILSAVVFSAYAVLTALSFMAFFGFMSTVQHKLEKENVTASARYTSMQASLEKAEAQVQASSRYADPAALSQSQRELQALQPQLEQVKRDMSRHANPDCSPKRDSRGNVYTTRAAEWCAQLQALQAQARPWQEQVDGYAQYQAALAHKERVLNEVAALDSGKVEVGGSHLHPMFVDLGKLVTAAPEEMKVGFMFISSASAEILGTLSILIASLLGRKRSFTLDEIETLSGQLREQQVRLQHAMAFSGLTPLPQPEATVTVKTSPMPTETEPEDGFAGMGTRQGSPHAVKARPKPSIVIPRPARQLAPPPHISDAILKGECPPQVDALVQRYDIAPHSARAYLKYMAEQDFLFYDQQRRAYVLTLRKVRDTLLEPNCNGVEYQRVNAAVKVLFPNPKALLPVRHKAGSTSLVPWGRRNHEPSRLPPGACAPLSTIHAGEWKNYNPRPVIIPATGYCETDHQGQKHWFSLDDHVSIQGLLAQAGDERRIYVVTVETPPEFAGDESLPRPEGWPRLIELDQAVDKQVIH